MAYADQCFPKGAITISGTNGNTYSGNVSAMGDITINYTGGKLYGKIDTLGNFRASNEYDTVRGTVDTSCPETSLSQSITPSLCTRAYANGCTREADYQQMQTAYNLYGIAPGGGSLEQCRKQIDDYIQATAKWNQCMVDSYGYNTQAGTWAKTKAQIETESTTASSSQQVNTSTVQCPLNSHLNSYYGTCSCNGGLEMYLTDYNPTTFKKNDFKCGTHTEALQALGIYMHGPYSHYNPTGNNFLCNDGYIPSSSNVETFKCIISTSTSKLVTSQSSTSSFSTIFTRILKKGMFGDDVKQLQILLQKLNYLPSTQVPSTYFGSITNNALIKFQRDNRIQPATGSFGPVTQAKLISLTNN